MLIVEINVNAVPYIANPGYIIFKQVVLLNLSFYAR